jgi:hypothetical protein
MGFGELVLRLLFVVLLVIGIRAMARHHNTSFGPVVLTISGVSVSRACCSIHACSASVGDRISPPRRWERRWATSCLG